MTERTKVYALPDILPAPHSDVGAMARTLIEYADLSVVPALLDELRRVDPDKEKQLRDQLTEFAVNWIPIDKFPYPRPLPDWQSAVYRFIRLFWFDLFDLTDTTAKMEEELVKASEPPDYGEYAPGTPAANGLLGPVNYGPTRFLAVEDISAGQYIELRRSELQAVLAENQDPDPLPES